MAYIDDLQPRKRRKPLITGAPAADPVNVSYNGPTPIDVNGNPNPGYDGNTGIRPPRIPPVVKPPPIRVPPEPPSPSPVPPTSPWGPDQGAGGGQAVPRTQPPRTQPPPIADPNNPPPVVPPKPPSSVGQYINPYWNTAKLESDAPSPLYSVRRAVSHFDPTKGITPEVLAALNALGLGTFERLSDDKVRITNPDAGWEDYTDWDLIEGFNTGNGRWGGSPFGGSGYEAEQAAAAQQQAQAAASAEAASPATSGATSGAGGGAGVTTPTPTQGPLALDPLSDELGGSGGMDLGVSGPFGYDDPSTQQLERFLRMLIDEKTNPIADPARDQYANTITQAFRQLTDPALTTNDYSRLENRALEPMDRERQVRIQQAVERLAAQGHGRGSGTYEQAISDINRQFDQRRGEVQRDLSIYDREQTDARRRESLSLAEALSNLSGQQRGEQDARMREALTYVSLFPEMDERRLRLAMETLGMSNSMANTPSIFNTLSSLSAQANAAAQQGRASNASFWGQMGQWLAQNWEGG